MFVSTKKTTFLQARESGMATLVFTIILLAVVSVLSLNSSKIAVLETRIASNGYLSNQAFQAAQAGMRLALTQISRQSLEAAANAAGGNGVVTSAWTKLPLTAPAADQVSEYQIVYSTTTAFTYTEIAVSVQGRSLRESDTSVTRTLTQNMRFQSTIRGDSLPVASMITRGVANVSGSSLLTAIDSKVTLWSGGNSVIGAANTEIDAGVTGGVYENDGNLSGLAAGDAFFNNFFAQGKSAVQDYANVLTCSPGPCSAADITPLATQKKIIYVKGDLNINSGATFGSDAEPVTLIVEGALTIAGGARIKGVVFTTSDFNNGNNSGRIDGALIVDGNATTTGNFTFSHDNNIVNALNQSIGFYVPIDRTWME